jgi:hypothetical protein
MCDKPEDFLIGYRIQKSPKKAKPKTRAPKKITHQKKKQPEHSQESPSFSDEDLGIFRSDE